VTMAVGALALSPHAAWLIANDFAPFSYAVAAHGTSSSASALAGALGYLAGSIGYVAVPLVIVFLATRPTRAAIKDMAWPTTPERRLAAVAFWAGLVVPAVVAPLAGVQLVSLWSMSAWTLLPVMLLSSPLVAISRSNAMRVLALAVVFPFAMIAVAPAIAFGIHRAGPWPGAAHSSVVVEAIERLWRETTDRPLKVFAGYDEFTDGVSFYMHGHPLAAHLLDHNNQHAMDEDIARDGIALLCPERAQYPPSAVWCRNAAMSVAARFPASKQREVEVSRRYLGVDGRPARYLLWTIPPRQ
jgi:hypothetical protein